MPSTKPSRSTRSTPASQAVRPPAHHIVILAFEHAQMLDVAGPADAFAMARRFDPASNYRLRCASPHGGLIRLSNGMQMQTQAIHTIRPSTVDTLLVAGAERMGLESALADEALAQWARKVARHARRIVSVCVGSLALAHWGLLEGRRATTHWSMVDALQLRYPAVRVDRTALFVQDGPIWTSGGVTTGIDMSLALIESDSNRHLAGQVAAALVMSTRRLGNQAQYSSELRAQTGRYAALVEWMSAHLQDALAVDTLAAQAGEAPRTFFRRFASEVGTTPAQFVEDLRLQAARRVLEGGASVKTATRAGGFTSAEQLARAFKRRLHMSPTEYSRQHGAKGSGQ